MTPDSGGPLDLPDEPTPTLLHLTDEEHAAGLRKIMALGRQDRRTKVDRALAAMAAIDATRADRNAAEARADDLRREVERLSSRCLLLAGLAVFGWATVAGLLLSS
jgi:hypothetical protein